MNIQMWERACRESLDRSRARRAERPPLITVHALIVAVLLILAGFALIYGAALAASL